MFLNSVFCKSNLVSPITYPCSGAWNTHAPNLANTLAGVSLASRMRMGRSGLCCLIVWYFDRMNCLGKNIYIC